ncbi:hypothetical protein C8A03DRAFT_31349 [Achaetomium macrosporum]|uniref:Uncharacterized protein n=1 Tax=Achaetomium macrosporum TaxID=79813 RepID=A0AAN7CEE7_9PEZI|nr:hypothetical protein C8A03DRAFT_31349 [Achaetomium macrosporum]
MGWREEERNPKKTFDMLVHYFENRHPRNSNAAVATLPAPHQINNPSINANDKIAGATPAVSPTEFEELRTLVAKIQESVAPSDAAKALEKKLDVVQGTAEANHNTHRAKILEIKGQFAKIEKTAAHADTVKALEEKLDLVHRTYVVEKQFGGLKRILNSHRYLFFSKFSTIEGQLGNVNIQGLVQENGSIQKDVGAIYGRLAEIVSKRAEMDNQLEKMKDRLAVLEDKVKNPEPAATMVTFGGLSPPSAEDTTRRSSLKRKLDDRETATPFVARITPGPGRRRNRRQRLERRNPRC